MKAYVILPNRYYGGEIALQEDTKGIPAGSTRMPPPPTLENQYVVWNGNGWLITSIAPPAEPTNQIEQQEEVIEEQIEEQVVEETLEVIDDGVVEDNPGEQVDQDLPT